jgi:hypothetical protein
MIEMKALLSRGAFVQLTFFTGARHIQALGNVPYFAAVSVGGKHSSPFSIYSRGYGFGYFSFDVEFLLKYTDRHP